MRSERISRRSVLVGLAGATFTAACGIRRNNRSAPQASAASSSSAPTVVLGMQLNQMTIPSKAAAAFQREHPEIKIVASYAANNLHYQLRERFEGPRLPTLGRDADLTEALRTLNLDASSYLPGTMGFWTNQGHILGVPVSETPWGLIWRPDAFEAAGIPAPRSDWTFNEFYNACAALQGLAKSGRLKGLRAALGAISPQSVRAPQLPFAGTLALGGMWQAFVWGFGGRIASGDRFSLTDPKTVTAIQTLCDLSKEFSISYQTLAALPKPTPDTFSAWLDEMFTLVGMSFWMYGAGLPTSYKWARLPRFPVDPVIPVMSAAIVLQAQGAPLPAPGSPQTLAAVRFGTWLNSPGGAQTMGAAGVPPATADPSVQNAFWSGAGPGAAAPTGDWRHFRDVYDGFPLIPPQDYVTTAITEVLAGRASAAAALAKAEQQMNNLLSGIPVTAAPATGGGGE